MNKIFFVIALCLFVSCSSIELPEKEESMKIISSNNAKIMAEEIKISLFMAPPKQPNDFYFALKLETLNNLLKALAESREEDLIIDFLKTERLIEETKSVAGMKFTNYAGINKGNLKVNLEKFSFYEFDNGLMKARIRLSGAGRIEAAGKYTGVSASVEPDVEIVVDEFVEFILKPQGMEYMVLKPVGKEITLKIKISIEILGWGIPWSEDIKLRIEDIIKPVKFPVKFEREIDLPVPAQDFSHNNKFESRAHVLILSDTKAEIGGKYIKYKANFDIKKK